jgi:hypothetical protein
LRGADFVSELRWLQELPPFLRSIRDDGKSFVVRADEKLTAFLELESATPAAERPEDCGGLEIKFDKLSRVSKSLLDYVIRRFNVSSARLNKPQGLNLR